MRYLWILGDIGLVSSFHCAGYKISVNSQDLDANTSGKNRYPLPRLSKVPEVEDFWSQLSMPWTTALNLAWICRQCSQVNWPCSCWNSLEDSPEMQDFPKGINHQKALPTHLKSSIYKPPQCVYVNLYKKSILLGQIERGRMWVCNF